MRFRTELSPEPSSVKITHRDSILLFGSCFSSSIGHKLQKLKFNTLINPYGTLYHPYSITKNLRTSIEGHSPSRSLITRIDERYVHYDFHSHISAKNEEDLVELIQIRRKQVRDQLQKASFLFVTLGAAFHFYHRDLNEIVSNCHKQPGSSFERRLSSVHEITGQLSELIRLAHTINPKVHIIFTVSPVRHIRDGLVANNVSKSHLLSAVHEIVRKQNAVMYFPAYEMMMDDLRDYRFYSPDLIHPNEQAVDYIWEHFETCFFDEFTVALNNKISKINSRVNHRPFDFSSILHQKMLDEMLQEIDILEKQHSLDFSIEKNAIASSTL